MVKMCGLVRLVFEIA